MFSRIATRYDITNSVLSLGVHHLWRRKLISRIPASADSLGLDVCTGTADLVKPLAKRVGSAIGADFCLPMLKGGRRKLDRIGSSSLLLIQGDALSLPFQDSKFDVVTVAFGVRNLERLDQGLAEMHRVLKPGGQLLVLEFGQPPGIFFGPIYRWYSKNIIPIIGGLLTGNRDAYSYLPETASEFPCGEEFLEQLAAVGFSSVESESLTFGISYLYSAGK